MAELSGAYFGDFVGARDKNGIPYEDERAQLVGQTGFILLYREFGEELLQFVPENTGDEMLSIPHGTRTAPLKTDILLFETANSSYEFEHVRRIR